MRKIMKRLALLLILFTAAPGCSVKTPTSIAQGTWVYQLLMNGVKIGTASVSNSQRDGLFISAIQMDMVLGDVKNTTRQVITETADFKPVKLEIYNTVLNGKKRQEINTIAEFKDKTVELTAGGQKTRFTIEKPFILDGNYFMDFLIKKRFKKGTQVSALLYDPTFETEEPINVRMKVKGHEEVTINGKTKQLIHIVQRIENSKNIDIFIDENGIAQKAIILMLNNRIELIIK